MANWWEEDLAVVADKLAAALVPVLLPVLEQALGSLEAKVVAELEAFIASKFHV